MAEKRRYAMRVEDAGQAGAMAARLRDGGIAADVVDTDTQAELPQVPDWADPSPGGFLIFVDGSRWGEAVDLLEQFVDYPKD